MGNCYSCYEEEYINPFHSYKINTLEETESILRCSMILCYICNQYIENKFEEIVRCNQCKKIVGHLHCLSMYNLNNNKCPICKE